MKRIGRTLAIALSITLMAAAGLAVGRARVARADDYGLPPSTGIAEGTWQIGRASCRERV